MATFSEHIKQSKENLEFLESINNSDDTRKFWDWQVTSCFYIAVHLINAHTANFELHYRSHDDVNKALNPFSKLSPCKFNEDEYLAYTKLQNLSRRSRYLVSDNLKDKSEGARFTYEKHLKKAIVHLDTLLESISSKYEVNFEHKKIHCQNLKDRELRYFKKIS